MEKRKTLKFGKEMLCRASKWNLKVDGNSFTRDLKAFNSTSLGSSTTTLLYLFNSQSTNNFPNQLPCFIRFLKHNWNMNNFNVCHFLSPPSIFHSTRPHFAKVLKFFICRRKTLKRKLREVTKLNCHLNIALIFYCELNCLFTKFLHVYFYSTAVGINETETCS